MDTRHNYIMNKIKSFFIQRINSIWNGYLKEQEHNTKKKIAPDTQKEINDIISEHGKY